MMVNNERVEKIATGIVDMLLNRTEDCKQIKSVYKYH